MTGIVEFIRARLDEDEWWAREASRPRNGAPIAGGVHWQWVDPSGDRVLTIDPMLGELLNDGGRADLRSVEEFPTRSVGVLPLFAVSYAEEVPSVVAGHIARHDPARVLRDVAGKRRTLARHEAYEGRCVLCCTSDPDDGWHPAPCGTVRDLASAWPDHQDYDQAWTVDG